jgi:hypothetical protein
VARARPVRPEDGTLVYARCTEGFEAPRAEERLEQDMTKYEDDPLNAYDHLREKIAAAQELQHKRGLRNFSMAYRMILHSRGETFVTYGNNT